ncbi:hypothetical protein G6F42_017653 [Rhizopus arrhizus]|nr:hypothetical protein G6F42_017653 [Rhizopus arrhizus]KAG1168207.1 hypothetical protein G6F36_012300 [Rhizopus arrhizus]
MKYYPSISLSSLVLSCSFLFLDKSEITHLKSEIVKLKSRPLPTPQRGQSSKPSAPESLSDFDTASSVAEDCYPHDDYSVARLNTTTADINPKHRRYATPIFRGNGKDDPLEWLLAFGF